jgi:Cu+-exporting ATPase
MAGDGLNDAGALRQADVGVAVTEDVASFSPASDVILQAGEVPRIAAILDFSRRVVRVVRISFLVSTAYNVVGLAIAASGKLSPIVCAVLMPLSSVSVVLVACGLTEWVGRRAGVAGRVISSTAVHSVPMEAKKP